MTNYAGVAAALSLLAGSTLCSAGTSDTEWVQIGPTHQASVAVPEQAHLLLDLAIGEVEIIGTTGDTLRARMEIECKSSNGRCAKRAEQATLTTQSDGDDIVLAVSPGGMKSYKGSNVRITVEVPRSEALRVEFGAGALSIRDVDACLSLQMFAGEADLRLDSTRIDDVVLKTGMGESTLYLGDGSVEGRRPLLVGSKVRHELGKGDCHLDARLRFGELTAHLR